MKEDDDREAAEAVAADPEMLDLMEETEVRARDLMQREAIGDERSRNFG